MKVSAIALWFAGLLLAGPLYADPIATLTCQGAGAAAFSSAVYYFSASNTAAELILDATTFPTILSLVDGNATFTSCVLTGAAGSLTMHQVSFNQATFDANFPSDPTDQPSSLNLSNALYTYAATGLAYSSLSATGDTPGLRGNFARPQPAASPPVLHGAPATP